MGRMVRGKDAEAYWGGVPGIWGLQGERGGLLRRGWSENTSNVTG